MTRLVLFLSLSIQATASAQCAADSMNVFSAQGFAPTIESRASSIVTFLRGGYLGEWACSGTLIGQNIILAAGHCYISPGDLAVFTSLPGHPASTVSRVIVSKDVPSLDYALYELSGVPQGATVSPVVIQPPSKGDLAVMLGHPFDNNGLNPTANFVLSTIWGEVRRLSWGFGRITGVSVTDGNPTIPVARSSIYAQAGASGSGMFDSSGRVFAVNSYFYSTPYLPAAERTCALGGGSILIREIVRDSYFAPYRGYPGLFGDNVLVRVRASNYSSSMRIAASCGPQTCQRQSDNGANSAELSSGCDILCPKNSTVAVSCDAQANGASNSYLVYGIGTTSSFTECSSTSCGFPFAVGVAPTEFTCVFD